MRSSSAASYIEHRDAIARDWWPFLHRALPQWGPLLLPNDPPFVERLLNTLQPGGLLLTGGNDLGKCALRDQSEQSALKWMVARRRPVFGVCRGMQLIVLYRGGTLRSVDRRVHVGGHHPIQLEKKFLQTQMGYEPPASVNSFHCWQAIPAPQDTAAVFAKANDGSAEGICVAENRLMGIMWHPEREDHYHPGDLYLFRNHFEDRR